MVSGKCLHAARAVYHSLSVLTNNHVLERTTRDNKKPIITALLENSLDHNKGSIQQKTAVSQALTTQQFNADEVLACYQELSKTEKLTWQHGQTVQAQVTEELAVITEYLKCFGSSNTIVNVHATFDSIPTSFDKQKQTNPDFIVNLLARLIPKTTYQDAKGGMGMVKHATRGSLGIFTYDPQGNLIRTTQSPLSLEAFNKNRVNSIIDAVKIDNKMDDFSPLFPQMREILLIKDVRKQTEALQKFLWDNFQCDSRFTRSISFVLPVDMQNVPINETTLAFAHGFSSRLENRMYNLDNTQDRRAIFLAMLSSYKENVDSTIIDRIYHLNNHCDVKINRFLLQDIAFFLKQGLINL